MRRSLVSWMLGLVAAVAVAPDVPATLAIYVSPEGLAERASVIVEGRVRRVASGLDPEARTLSTYVTLDVDRVHRGPGDLAMLTLREPGGRFGNVVHDVDGVAIYRPGEDVLVFLEPAADGALRTAGLFLGKFGVQRPERGAESAVRRLGGGGRFVGQAPADAIETLPLRDLISVAVGVPGPVARPWLARPAEMERLRWDDVLLAPWASPDPPRMQDATFAPTRGGSLAPLGDFEPFESEVPARWNQVDDGISVRMDYRLEHNPFGDPEAALAGLVRAMESWSEVPESRLDVRPGEVFDYVGQYEQSPVTHFSGSHIVLFGDPYEDISDPVNCAGVLAIGGYWRTTDSVASVNGVSFAQVVQAYVIFNDGFECYLSDPDNFAEIAAHEIGHVLGFGHSPADDALMRSWPYGEGRGPRLGDDDRDAAHCHYPHRLELLEPREGERWMPGQMGVVAWSASQESGPDPGTVTIEMSVDGGLSWAPAAVEVPNDGHHEILAPDETVQGARVRILRANKLQQAKSPFPGACTSVTSGGFSIGEAPPPEVERTLRRTSRHRVGALRRDVPARPRVRR